MLDSTSPAPTPAFLRATDALRSCVAEPLPGRAAQLSMAPDHRRREAAAPGGPGHREAAVLALLVDGPRGASILLTRRRSDLPDHAGQISFPGGRREPGEDLSETALREAHEEVNLVPGAVQVLGPLTPLYIPPSNFHVTPFLAAAVEPLSLCPCDREVESLIFTDLSRLMDPSAVRREPWIIRRRTVQVPFYDVDGHKVWGATAMMLAEIVALLRGVPSDGLIQRQGINT